MAVRAALLGTGTQRFQLGGRHVQLADHFAVALPDVLETGVAGAGYGGKFAPHCLVLGLQPQVLPLT